MEVVINTSPSAQRVQYINLIKYDLCGLQGLDPKGPRCDRWVDYSASSGLGAMMSGQYKVRVTWLDGTAEFRDLNVDDLPKDADPKTFSIRK